jgi:four helix bundle protein
MDFTDLDVWKKARLYRNKTIQLSKTFSPEEKFRLTDQLIRAVRSITANIAEGDGRYHYQENIQFCRIARGSLKESLDHLIAAYDDNILQKVS